MTVITLRPITKENWEEAAKLEVSDEQRHFVAPNVWTLAETQFYPWVQRFAIYAGQQMVGFLACGRHPEDNRYWLNRFMIDQRFQRRGYGRAALAALIDRLRADPGIESITVGYEKENTVAEALYLSMGFQKSGRAPWGEETATMALS